MELFKSSLDKEKISIADRFINESKKIYCSWNKMSREELDIEKIRIMDEMITHIDIHKNYYENSLREQLIGKKDMKIIERDNRFDVL
jgi:hypothetical protein